MNEVAVSALPPVDTSPVHPPTRPARVAKNMAALASSQVMVQAAGVVLGIMVARALGGAGYGAYTLAFAFVNLFGLLFSLGIDTIVVREVARAPEQASAVVAGALRLRLACFPLALATIAVAARLAGYDVAMRDLIILAALAVGLSAAGDLARAVFQGLQRMELDTLTRGVEKGLTLALAAFVLLGHRAAGVETVVWAMMIGAIASLCIAWLALARLVHLARRVRLGSVWRLLAPAAPLAGSMVIMNWVGPLPAVMLSRVSTLVVVGHFSAATSVIAPFALLAMAFAGALLPVMTKTFETPGAPAQRAHDSLLAWALLASAPMAAAVRWFGVDLVSLLYGPSFAAGEVAITILAFLIPIVWLNTYLANVLIAIGAQRFLLAVVVLQLAATVALGGLWIPNGGLHGAALTAVAGQLAGTGLSLYLTSCRLRYRAGRGVLTALSVVAMLLAVDWILGTAPMAVRVLVSLALYLVGLRLSGLVSIKQIYRAIRAGF